MTTEFNNRVLGANKEHLAIEYLKKQGFIVMHQNYRCRLGEIDIIGKDGDYFVFVEVKYRSSTKMGYATEAVNFKKQKQICKVADFFRLQNQLGMNTPMRFDAVSIQGDELQWIKNAFNYRPWRL